MLTWRDLDVATTALPSRRAAPIFDLDEWAPRAPRLRRGAHRVHCRRRRPRGGELCWVRAIPGDPYRQEGPVRGPQRSDQQWRRRACESTLLGAPATMTYPWLPGWPKWLPSNAAYAVGESFVDNVPQRVTVNKLIHDHRAVLDMVSRGERVEITRRGRGSCGDRSAGSRRNPAGPAGVRRKGAAGLATAPAPTARAVAASDGAARTRAADRFRSAAGGPVTRPTVDLSGLAGADQTCASRDQLTAVRPPARPAPSRAVERPTRRPTRRDGRASSRNVSGSIRYEAGLVTSWIVTLPNG